MVEIAPTIPCQGPPLTPAHRIPSPLKATKGRGNAGASSGFLFFRYNQYLLKVFRLHAARLRNTPSLSYRPLPRVMLASMARVLITPRAANAGKTLIATCVPVAQQRLESSSVLPL